MNSTVYVGDLQNSRVQMFDITSDYIDSFGSAGSGDGEFNRVMGLAVYQGVVYVCDYDGQRIQVFDKDGDFVRLIGSSGSKVGQLLGPTGIDVYNDHIYVADTFNQRIQIFDLEGNFVAQIVDVDHPLWIYPNDVTVVYDQIFDLGVTVQTITIDGEGSLDLALSVFAFSIITLSILRSRFKR